MKVQLFMLALLLSGVLLNAQNILLVDDSNDSFDNTSAIGNGLTNNGLAFDLFNAADSAASPSFALMTDYDLVIWHTSSALVSLNFWNQNETDNTNLSQYLDEGGNLWLIGNDFLSNRYGGPPDTFQNGDFVYDYLGITQFNAESFNNDGLLGLPQVRPVEGQPIPGLTLIFWQLPTLPDADAITAREEAIAIYEMGHDNYVLAGEITGMWYAGANHRALTFAFALALANNQGLIDATIGSVVDFFAGFIVDTEEINDVATTISVYPNPSSAVARLSFNLKEAAVVNVDVVNMLGQQVATVLSSTTLASGTHQLDWQPKTSLPNGLYQFRITVNGQLTQKAVTLNR